MLLFYYVNDGYMAKVAINKKTMEKGPWRVVSSSVKYVTPWITVVEENVVRPDGKPGVYSFVKGMPGSTILPLDENGFVYLAKEYKYAVEKETIEAPSGGVIEGKNFLQTAKRELREELGIEAGEFISLGFVEPLTAWCNAPIGLFLARELRFIDAQREGTERIEMIKVKLENAVGMVMSGEITNSASVAAILKASKWLECEEK